VKPHDTNPNRGATVESIPQIRPRSLALSRSRRILHPKRFPHATPARVGSRCSKLERRLLVTRAVILRFAAAESRDATKLARKTLQKPGARSRAATGWGQVQVRGGPNTAMARSADPSAARARRAIVHVLEQRLLMRARAAQGEAWLDRGWKVGSIRGEAKPSRRGPTEVGPPDLGRP
jgi:hypothetical protein